MHIKRKALGLESLGNCGPSFEFSTDMVGWSRISKNCYVISPCFQHLPKQFINVS